MKRYLIFAGIILLSLTNLFSFSANVFKESDAGKSYIVEFDFGKKKPQFFVDTKNVNLRIMGSRSSRYLLFINGGEDNSFFADFASSENDFNKDGVLNNLVEKYGYNKESTSSLYKAKTYENKQQFEVEYSKKDNPLKVFSRRNDKEVYLEAAEASEIKEMILFVPMNTAVSGKFHKGNLAITDLESEVNFSASKMYALVKRSKGVINLEAKSGEIEVDDFDGVLKMEMTASEVDFKNIKGLIELENNILEGKFKNIEANMKIISSACEFELDEFLGEELKVDATGGTFELKDMKGNAEIDLDITAGEITLENSSFKSFKCDTQGGELEFKNISGVININSTAGDINIRNFKPGDSQKSSVDLTFGNIYLTLDGDDYKFSKSGSKYLNAKSVKEGFFNEMIITNNADKKVLELNVSTGSIIIK